MSMPENWIECAIGDVARVVAGGTPPSKDESNFTLVGGVPWITPADLSGYRRIYIERGARNLTDKGFGSCSAQKMPAGTVLFSSRAPIGYVAVAANEVTTNQGFKSFVLPSELDSRYVYYYLKHIKPVAESMATGTTFKELSGAAAAKIPFLVSPSNEQKRIADKLDAVLARVDACRERLDRIPAILKRLRQSVLAAATSGKLTEHWRAEMGLGEVTQAYLGDHCDVLGGKRLPKGFELTDQDTGYPYIRVTDFDHHSVRIGQLRFVPKGAVPAISRYIINSSDVYVSIAGTVGLVGHVPDSISGANLTENAARVVVRDGFLSRFLMYQLASPSVQEQMREKKIATTQEKLGLFRIKELLLKKPSLEEQVEIVRRIEGLFAYCDHIESKYAGARAQVEHLTPALLAKAFRGELVPQDSNDEPATKLLKRIKDAGATPISNKRRVEVASQAEPTRSVVLR